MHGHVVERTREVALALGKLDGISQKYSRLGLGLEPRLVGRGTIYVVAGSQGRDFRHYRDVGRGGPARDYDVTAKRLVIHKLRAPEPRREVDHRRKASFDGASIHIRASQDVDEAWEKRAAPAVDELDVIRWRHAARFDVCDETILHRNRRGLEAVGQGDAVAINSAAPRSHVAGGHVRAVFRLCAGSMAA